MFVRTLHPDVMGRLFWRQGDGVLVSEADYAAVNLADRLETLARDLDRDLVLSAAFAARSTAPLDRLSTFELKGFRDPQEVFAPAPPRPG